MLTIYPRHLHICEIKLKAKGLSPAELGAWKKCRCPLWIRGTDPRGHPHRRSLNTTSYEVAENLKRDLELGIEVKPKVTIADALRKWTDALLAAKRKPATIAQVHGAMAISLDRWSKNVGLVHLDELNLDRLNEWIKTWDYASTTHRSRIDRARQFFRFAIAHKWLSENPASGLIKPAEDLDPTLPFTVEEEEKLFAAASRFGARRHYDGLWSANPKTARALMAVMRWTGLRASDAILFEPRRIRIEKVDGLDVALYGTYQTKTGEWVLCPIPPNVAAEIIAAPRLCEEASFIPPGEWGHKTDPRAVTNSFYASYLLPLGAMAGVAEVRAHRWRDTFAVRLLEAGKPLEIVQMLLGHSSIKTTEAHYSPWVRSRQQMLIREVMQTWH